MTNRTPKKNTFIVNIRNDNSFPQLTMKIGWKIDIDYLPKLVEFLEQRGKKIHITKRKSHAQTN